MKRVTGKFKNALNVDLFIDKIYKPGEVFDVKNISNEEYDFFKTALEKKFITKATVEATSIQVSEEPFDEIENDSFTQGLHVTDSEQKSQQNKAKISDSEAIAFVNQHFKTIEKKIKKINDPEILELYLQAARHEVKTGAIRVLEERITDVVNNVKRE